MREPNALGLFDTHGNLWELTSDGHIRGGSWRDGVISARAANLVELGGQYEHALVGARLVYAGP